MWIKLKKNPLLAIPIPGLVSCRSPRTVELIPGRGIKMAPGMTKVTLVLAQQLTVTANELNVPALGPVATCRVILPRTTTINALTGKLALTKPTTTGAATQQGRPVVIINCLVGLKRLLTIRGIPVRRTLRKTTLTPLHLVSLAPKTGVSCSLILNVIIPPVLSVRCLAKVLTLGLTLTVPAPPLTLVVVITPANTPGLIKKPRFRSPPTARRHPPKTVPASSGAVTLPRRLNVSTRPFFFVVEWLGHFPYLASPKRSLLSY